MPSATTPTPTFTIRPAPNREPPFDDEIGLVAPHWTATLQRPLPFGPVHPPLRARPALVTHSARRAAVPEPGLWTRRLLIGIIEAAGGQRALGQLEPMLSPSVAFGLREDLGGGRANRHWLRGARIASLRPTEPADGVAEVCATLRTARRTHAVAIRLEIKRGRWLCTRLILG